MSHSIDIGEMKARFDSKSGFITLSSSDKNGPLRKNGIIFNVPSGTKKYDILKTMIEEDIKDNGDVPLEVEAKLPKIVHLSDKYRSKDSTLIPLGIDKSRKTQYWNVNLDPHLVITGQSGTGKSEVIKMIVDHVNTHRKDTRAIYFNPGVPDEVIRYENFKNVHENLQIVEKGQMNDVVISRIHNMMEERYSYLEEMNLSDMDAGIRVGEFKRVFFMIDDFRYRRYTENTPLLVDILRRGKSVGIHVALVVHGNHELARELFPDVEAVVSAEKVSDGNVTESNFDNRDEPTKRIKIFSRQR